MNKNSEITMLQIPAPDRFAPIVTRSAPLLAFAALIVFSVSMAAAPAGFSQKDLPELAGYMVFAAVNGLSLWYLQSVLWRPLQEPRRVVALSVTLALIALAAWAHGLLNYGLAYSRSAPAAPQILENILNARFWSSARQASIALLAVAILAPILHRRARWKDLVSPGIAIGLAIGSALAAHHVITLELARRSGFLVFAAVLPILAQAILLLALAWRRVPLRENVLPADRAPVRDGLDRNNRITFWLFALLAPIAASAASIIHSSVAIWALASLAARRFPIRLSRPQIAAGGIAFAFFVVMAAGTLFNLPDGGNLGSWLMIAAFTGPLLLASRLNLSPPRTLLPLMASAAMLALPGAFVLALWEQLFFRAGIQRVVLISGNSSVAATMIAAAIALALSGIDRLQRRQRQLRLISLLSGVGAILLTGSLAVIAATIAVFAIAAHRYRGHRGSIAAFFSASLATRRRAATTVAVAIAIVMMSVPMADRISRYASAPPQSGVEEADFGKRLAMWQASLKAISERPLVGYGVARRGSAIEPFLAEKDKKLAEFTHVHNGILTAGVAAGLPGMLTCLLLVFSPLAVTWRYARGPDRADLVMLGGALTAIYVIGGSTGIMFFHDAMDALFLMLFAIIAAACAPVGENSAGNRSQAG